MSHLSPAAVHPPSDLHSPPNLSLPPPPPAATAAAQPQLSEPSHDDWSPFSPQARERRIALLRMYPPCVGSNHNNNIINFAAAFLEK